MTRYLSVLAPLAVLGVLVAGCGGGGSSSLTPDDIAVVGGQHVTLEQYNALVAEEKASLKSQGQKFPAAGSTEYSTIRTDIITLLVQQAELNLQAQKLGITVSQAEVDKKLAELKKTNFGGNEKKYEAGIKAQGFTDAQINTYVHENLLEQKIFAKVTKGETTSQADVDAYYAANLTQFQQAASRAVQEILVGKNKQQLANQIYTQLKGGASFAALAKKYSQDPGSKDKGGNFTANKGSDVPEFDAAVFAPTAATGVLLKPVLTKQYGWFVIKPIAAITAAKTTTEKSAEAQIKKQLEQTKQQQAAGTWMSGIAKGYCTGGDIKYQSGYEPSPDPCVALTTSNQTTT